MSSERGAAQAAECEEVLDAVDAAARLVRAVGWLRVLVEPGREPRPAPPVLSDAARDRAQAAARAEAADRRRNLAAGLTAGAATAAPVRLHLLDVEARVARAVGRLVARVAHAGGGWRGGRVRDAAGVVAGLRWLTGYPASWMVTRAGQAARWRGALGELGESELAQDVADELAGLVAVVREAVGIRSDRVLPWPGGRCPACRLRTLQIDATLRDTRYWTVRCVSDACRCAGPGCPCRQRVRYEGRPHAWSYGELDGPYGLRRAIAAAARRQPVRSQQVGGGRA